MVDALGATTYRRAITVSIVSIFLPMLSAITYIFLSLLCIKLNGMLFFHILPNIGLGRAYVATRSDENSKMGGLVVFGRALSLGSSAVES